MEIARNTHREIRNRVDTYLQAAIEQSLRSGVLRLKPVETLAREAGVAKATMHRAVRRLVARGVVCARPGSGIRVIDQAAAPPAHRLAETPTTCASRAERLAALVARDIANAVYEEGAPLPRLKELCAVYGAGFRTMRAALHALCATGALEAWRRSYRVPSAAASSNASTVLVIARGTSEYVQLVTERTAQILTTLEQECVRRRLKLLVEPAWYDGAALKIGRESQPFRPGATGGGRLLGSLVLNSALSADSVREILSFLERTEAPVALIDDGGVEPPPRPSRALPFHTVSLPYAAGCGAAVGRYLAGLGHSRAAYVTAYPREWWSRKRQEGLARGFTRGLPGDGAIRRTVIAAGDGDSPPDRFEDQLRWFGGGHRAAAMHSYRALNRSLLWSESQIRRLENAFAPWDDISCSLDELLRERPITAWVADNDPTAILCLAFLESRGVRVPQDLSVCGFDDSTIALINGLTSYNFNCRAAVLASLRHILGPSSSRAGGGRTDIDGYVVSRHSTAGPRAGRGS